MRMKAPKRLTRGEICDGVFLVHHIRHRLVPINRDFYIIRQVVEQQAGAEDGLDYQLDYALEHCYRVSSGSDITLPLMVRYTGYCN